jgi:hypothetical protein
MSQELIQYGHVHLNYDTEFSKVLMKAHGLVTNLYKEKWKSKHQKKKVECIRESLTNLKTHFNDPKQLKVTLPLNLRKKLLNFIINSRIYLKDH